MYVVDVGVAQRGVLDDGRRQLLETACPDVEDIDGVVASYPQLFIVQVGVVGVSAKGDRLFQLQGGEIVTVELDGGHYPEVVIRVDMALRVEVMSGTDVGQHAGYLFCFGVVGIELKTSAHEDAPVAVFYDLPDVLIVGFDGDYMEVVLVGI